MEGIACRTMAAHAFQRTTVTELADELRARGHRVWSVRSLEEFVQERTRADVLLLHATADTVADGVAELERHAERLRDTGILVLGMRPELDSIARVAALRAGADVVLRYPASAVEIETHIAVLRRRSRLSAAGQHLLHHGPLTLDLVTRTAFDLGRPLDLSPLQFQILAYLIVHEARVVSGVEIQETIFRAAYARGSAVVRNQIRLLRLKLGRLAPWLRTVRGMGYRMAIREGEASDGDDRGADPAWLTPSRRAS